MYKQGPWEWLLASIMTCLERPGSSLFAETWQFQNLKPFGHFFLILRKIEKMAIILLKSKLFFHLISSDAQRNHLDETRLSSSQNMWET